MEYKKCQAIAFDFDGTLVQSNHIKRSAFFEVADTVAGRAVMESLYTTPGIGNRYAIFKKFTATLRISEQYETLLNAYTNLTHKKISACPEVLGASEILQQLHGQGLPLFINSATPDEFLLPLIKERGWQSFFKKCLGGNHSKAKNLALLAEQNRISPSNWLMIGDSDDDQMAAQEFACPFIGIEIEAGRFRKKPAVMINDLRMIPQALSKLRLEIQVKS